MLPDCRNGRGKARFHRAVLNDLARRWGGLFVASDARLQAAHAGYSVKHDSHPSSQANAETVGP